MGSFRPSANGLTIGFGLAVIGGLVLGGALAWRSAITPVLAACGCGQWLATPATGRIWPGAALLLIAASFIGRGVWFAVRLARREAALRRDFKQQGARPYHSSLIQSPVRIVATAERFAVTVGLIHPEIYVSQGLVSALSASELLAVLRHEEAHARARHPLISALVAATVAMWPMFPWLTTWAAIGRTDHEMTADAFASDRYRNIAPLASALVKLDAPVFRAGVAWTPLEARVDRLIEPSHEWRWFRTIRRGFIMASGVVGLVVMIGFLADRTASAQTAPDRRCVERQFQCRPTPPGRSIPIVQMSAYGR